MQLRNLNRGVETATEFVAPFVIMVVPLSVPELNYSEAVEFAVRFPVIHGLFVKRKFQEDSRTKSYNLFANIIQSMNITSYRFTL